MLPTWLGSLIAFVYGTVVGSFLNVCIYRMPAEQSIVSPPSHCPKCNTKLRGIDLVPLLSFLLLGRKCRYCGTPISWRYFMVELITGALFVATYLRYGYTLDFFPFVLFISALLIAFFVDLDCFIIPDQVWIVGIVLGIGRDVAHWIAGSLEMLRVPVPFTGFRLPVPQSVAGMVVCFAVFYLIAYVSYFVFRPSDEAELADYEGAMGAGDVKLAAGVGAVLGVVPALVSFFVAVLVGTVVSVTYLVIRARGEKKGLELRTAVPFGPFMVVGAITVILAYPQLMALWEAWKALVVRG